MTTIIGIKLNNRDVYSLILQDILTEFGCIINTRIGLHSNKDKICSEYGLILIEVDDNASMSKNFELELCKIENIEIQKMVFR